MPDETQAKYDNAKLAVIEGLALSVLDENLPGSGYPLALEVSALCAELRDMRSAMQQSVKSWETCEDAPSCPCCVNDLWPWTEGKR